MRSYLVLFLLLLLFALPAFAQKADVIFINGKIWTIDKQKPAASAVAVFHSRIIAVGTSAEIQTYADPASTKVIDLQGKFMMPGFNDNHVDLMAGGTILGSVNLTDAKNETDFGQIIKDFAVAHPNQWILGGGWDEQKFATHELPGKELIDLVTPNQGVYLTRYDGSVVLVNSYVLQLAGITKETPNPAGGLIEHDKNDDEPTGILKGTAIDLVKKLIPPPSEKENLERIRLALAEAAKNGITSIQDISSEAALRTYQTLKAKGELTARLYCIMPLETYEHFSQIGVQIPFGDEWIRIGSLNTSVDGSLGSSLASFVQPYGAASTNGAASDDFVSGNIQTPLLAADKAHLQISIDAVGDNANSLALNMFEAIVAQNPKWERRFRIEHASYISLKDISRLYGIEATACVQPNGIYEEGGLAEKLLGSERTKTSFPFRTFSEQKVNYCFGSDWPNAPLNPFLGLYAAITRSTSDGAFPAGWHPEQKLTTKEAIEAYTLKSAYAEFAENDKGSITVGKLADFVVLSNDLLTADPAQIPSLTVEMTVVGGKIVYTSSAGNGH